MKSQMTPTVTVGLPFYNNQDTLADAIRSILNQTYPYLDLLVVNDGSTDDSLTVVQSFDDPRIRIVNDGTNEGLAARLNQIAEMTETDLLFRMDADDIMHPDRVGIQVARLREPDSPDLVSSGAWTIDVENQIIGQYAIGAVSLNSARDVWLKRGFIVHPTVAGKTEWFRRNPYRQDIRRSEDWELWVRSFDDTSHVRITEPLLYYRQAEEVGIRNYRIAKAEQRKHLLRYGPALVGHGKTFRLRTQSHMQELAMIVSKVFGRTNIFMNRRYRELSEAELAVAQRGMLTAIAEPKS